MAGRRGPANGRCSCSRLEAVSLATGERRPLAAFAGAPAHALAGIGNPARFFDALRGHGIDVVEHPFPDHHAYRPEDFAGMIGLC